MTIRKKEAKEVVLDELARLHVPRALYSVKGRDVHLLVGSSIYKINIRAGQSYYGLQQTVERTRQACDEIERARQHRNQIDLEDLLKERAWRS